MKYLLIDTDGQINAHEGDIGEHLGDHGIDRISLNRGGLPLAGYIGGSALLMPDAYPRNPVAAAVLCSLGATPQPYAGNIAVTGFQRWPEPDPCSISQDMADYVKAMHADVRVALGLTPGALPQHLQGVWEAGVREAARIAREGEVPPIRFVQGGHVVGQAPAGDTETFLSEWDRLLGGR